MSRARLSEPTDPGVVRLVRLECHEAGSDKFYTPLVERDPDAPGAFRCRSEWGRVGGAVSTQTKATGDQATCERALDGIVRDKQRKGYRIVMDERAATTAPEPATADRAAVTTPPTSREDNLKDLLERRRREATWAL